MKIEIQARNFPLTHALKSYIERRLGFALGKRDEYIERILVRLYDINVPRAGHDKCCHIQVSLPQLSDLVIQDIEANLYVAIDRAAERASRTLARRLARQQRNKSRASYLPNYWMPQT